MAVVRNLMIRIGADYSPAKKGMDGASRELNRFKKSTDRTMTELNGKKGLGGVGSRFKTISSSVTQSVGEMRGSRGLAGMSRGLSALRPALGAAAEGFGGLTVAAAGSTAAIGATTLGIGLLVAALGIAAAAIGVASQEAVKFDANMGRLNMQLKGNTREFTTWARSVGLAKQSAVEMGATYSVLLSSFINDNDKLAAQTKEFVQATRIVASWTGRTIEDVTERMRSGLLGNTEAIEDLGIFVNVSMIESTNAFKRFAGDKSWDQLDFKIQQQIRLAAILEQAYARYGNSIQNNVMSKQTLLMEQLKDIKLNLSQAFMPIWDAILPALTALAKAIAYITEQLARFVYWLRGWDYEEMTSGWDQNSEAIADLGNQAGSMGDDFKEAGKEAKKARNEIAAFDRLNLLGDGSGGGSGSGGSGGSGGIGSGSGGGIDGGSNWKLPDLPKLPEMQLQFKPPNPPDAGIGAVATVVVDTINNLIAQIKAKLEQFWQDLNSMSGSGASVQGKIWDGMLNGMLGTNAVTFPTLQQQWNNLWGTYGTTATNSINVLTTGHKGLLDTLNANQGVQFPILQEQWGSLWATYENTLTSASSVLTSGVSTMWNNIKTTTSTAAAAVTTSFQTMLNNMQQKLTNTVPMIQQGFSQLNSFVKSLQPTLTGVQGSWYNTFEYFVKILSGYNPLINNGLSSLGATLLGVKNPLSDLKTAWRDTFNSMTESVLNFVTRVQGLINQAVSSLQNLFGMLGKSPSPQTGTSSPGAWDVNPDTGRVNWVDSAPILGDLLGALDKLSDSTAGFSQEAGKWVVPGAGLGGVGSAAGNAGKWAAGTADDFWKWLQGIGSMVPQFANGGVVSGPTLAMVGEYAGARSNPEVIAPLNDLQHMIEDTSISREAVGVLKQILTAVREDKTVQAVILESDVTNAAIRGVNGEIRRTGRNPFNL